MAIQLKVGARKSVVWCTRDHSIEHGPFGRRYKQQFARRAGEKQPSSSHHSPPPPPPRPRPASGEPTASSGTTANHCFPSPPAGRPAAALQQPSLPRSHLSATCGPTWKPPPPLPLPPPRPPAQTGLLPSARSTSRPGGPWGRPARAGQWPGAIATAAAACLSIDR